ncbi:hypothetical protein ACFRKB_31900 [Streptomyces scopuliridis]|uniref:hypothetical protein n=1 Tax=Streptomyces scopuliridis TaxID=452529 RepID=UPI0036CC7B89
MPRDELETLRDAGTRKSLVGSVAVEGLPHAVQHAPSAGATKPVTAPCTAPSPRPAAARLPVHVPTP